MGQKLRENQLLTEKYSTTKHTQNEGKYPVYLKIVYIFVCFLTYLVNFGRKEGKITLLFGNIRITKDFFFLI